MCPTHWSMVPADLRARVRAAFSPGQCAGLARPSEEWLAAAQAAVEAVAAAEGHAPRPARAHPLDGLLAISVHQPWARFLSVGLKLVENRHSIRVLREHLGRPVAIHATVQIDPGREIAEVEMLERAGALGGLAVRPADLARGAIVGVAVLTQVLDLADPERLAICAEGDPWVTGPVALCFAGAMPLRPVAAKGQPGLWAVEGAVFDTVRLHWDALSSPHARAARAYFLEALAHWRAVRDGAPPAEIPRLAPRAEREPELLAEAARSAAPPAEAAPPAPPEARVTGGAPAAPAEAPLTETPEGAWVIVDTETANGSPPVRLVEFALLRVAGEAALDAFDSLIDPGRPIEPGPRQVHGICDGDVRGKPGAAAVLARVAPCLRGAVVVAHNAHFDRRVVEGEYRLSGRAPPSMRWHCSLKAAKAMLPGETSYKLGDLAARLSVPRGRSHRALDDARATLGVLLAIARRRGVGVLDVIARGALDGAEPRRGRHEAREAHEG